VTSRPPRPRKRGSANSATPTAMTATRQAPTLVLQQPAPARIAPERGVGQQVQGSPHDVCQPQGPRRSAHTNGRGQD